VEGFRCSHVGGSEIEPRHLRLDVVRGMRLDAGVESIDANRCAESTPLSSYSIGSYAGVNTGRTGTILRLATGGRFV